MKHCNKISPCMSLFISPPMSPLSTLCLLLCLLFQPYVSSYVSSFNPMSPPMSPLSTLCLLLCFLFQPYVSSYVSSFKPLSPMSLLSTLCLLLCLLFQASVSSYVSSFNPMSPPMSPLSNLCLLLCLLFQPYVSSYVSFFKPLSPSMSPLSTLCLLFLLFQLYVSSFNPLSPLMSLFFNPMSPMEHILMRNKKIKVIASVHERFAGRWRRSPCWRSCTPSSQAESIIVTVSYTGRMDIFSTDFNPSWTRLRGWSWAFLSSSAFPPPSATNFTGYQSGNASSSKSLSSCDIVSSVRRLSIWLNSVVRWVHPLVGRVYALPRVVISLFRDSDFEDLATGFLLSLGPTCGTLFRPKLQFKSKLKTFLFQQSWALLWILI